MPETTKRSVVKAVAVPFVGAVVGAAAACAAALVVDGVDVLLEETLQVRGLSWEMGLFIIPVAAAEGGLLAGFCGALIGRRWVGAVVGAIGLGVAGLLFFALGSNAFAIGSDAMPMGTRVGCVAAGVLSGLAAGFAEGALTERFERRQAARVDARGGAA
jgi:hypothetical protein